MVVLVGILCTFLLDILLTLLMHEVAILGYATAIVIFLFFFECNFGYSSPYPESIVQNIVVQKRLCEFYTRNALYFNFFGAVALGGAIAFGLRQFSKSQRTTRAGFGAASTATVASAPATSASCSEASSLHQQGSQSQQVVRPQQYRPGIVVENVSLYEDTEMRNTILHPSNNIPCDIPGIVLWPVDEDSEFETPHRLVGGGGGKLKKKRPVKSMLTQSGLTEEQELQAALSISRRIVNNNNYNDIDGDPLEIMSANELHNQSTTAFDDAIRNRKVNICEFNNCQISNSCTSVATYSAARHVLVNEKLSTLTHFGTSMGLKMYKEAICILKESYGNFIGLDVNNKFIEGVSIEVESIGQLNLFDKQTRRELLEKLNQGRGRRVGIGKITLFVYYDYHFVAVAFPLSFLCNLILQTAILFNNHAFNLLSGPEGFILLDSLPTDSFDQGFQFICEDIDTLETALIMHATDRLKDTKTIMSKWTTPVNTTKRLQSDCRTFDASIYTCVNGPGM